MTFPRFEVVAYVSYWLVAIGTVGCARSEPMAMPVSAPPQPSHRECTPPPPPPVVSVEPRRELEYGFLDIERLDPSKSPRVEAAWSGEPLQLTARGFSTVSGSDVWLVVDEKSATTARRFAGGQLVQTMRLPRAASAWHSSGDGEGGLWVFEVRGTGTGALTGSQPIGLVHVPAAAKGENPKPTKITLDWPGVELRRILPAPDGGLFVGITVPDVVDFGNGHKVGVSSERVDAIALFDRDGVLAWITPLPDVVPDRIESISATPGGSVYVQSVFRDTTGSRAVITLDARGARTSTRVIRMRNSMLLIAPWAFDGPHALDSGGWFAAGDMLTYDFGSGPLRASGTSSAAVVAFDVDGRLSWAHALGETVLQAKAFGDDAVILTMPELEHVRVQVVGPGGVLAWSALLGVPERCQREEAQEWEVAPASDAIHISVQCPTHIDGDWTRPGPVIMAFADVVGPS